MEGGKGEELQTSVIVSAIKKKRKSKSKMTKWLDPVPAPSFSCNLSHPQEAQCLEDRVSAFLATLSLAFFHTY